MLLTYVSFFSQVDGKPRKSCHVGKWEKVYDLCLKSLSVLEDIATKRRRNFILDQVGEGVEAYEF